MAAEQLPVGELDAAAPPEVSQSAEFEPVTRDSLAADLSDAANLDRATAERLADAMVANGYVVEGAPVARKILLDAQTFAERTILAELVVRLFRFFVLGSIVLPDTPLVMDWLKSYIDGNGHGPLGAGPLRWPRMCPSAINVLIRWGFEPTPSEPPYVIRRRQG